MDKRKWVYWLLWLLRVLLDRVVTDAAGARQGARR